MSRRKHTGNYNGMTSKQIPAEVSSKAEIKCEAQCVAFSTCFSSSLSWPWPPPLLCTF